RNSSGYDIIFTSEDGGTQYAHELESYNASTGALQAWVKLPNLSTSSATAFKMYFGNASVSTNQSSNATWNSNFLAVWHLNDDLVDATGNGHNGSSTNVDPASTSVIGNAQNFDGNDYIEVPYSSDFAITDTLTLSAW